MIYLLVLFALFGYVLTLIDRPSKKKIEGARDSVTAIHYRKQLLRNRKIAYFVFVALIVASDVFILKDIVAEGDTLVLGFTLLAVIGSLVLLYFFLHASNQYLKIQGRVSTFSASEFISENERFILFLRGFESDAYHVGDIGKWDFSEEKLSKVVEKGLGIPMCAIGMTKEADSPLGGTRVYVDDENWEETVVDLMRKAEKIIILVNDRDSCLWEIQQAHDLMDKCSFIINDLVKYQKARTVLSGRIDLPEIPFSGDKDLSLEQDPRCFFFTADRQMKDFEGTIANYCEIIGLDRSAVSYEELKEKTPFYQRPWFMFISALAILRAISLLIIGH